MGLKALQVLPGLPVAPGHKNLLIVPFFLLASALTHGRFGGLWTGLTTGLVSVMLGYGKYGILEVAHFAVPGLMADLLLPLTHRRGPRWLRLGEFAVVGALMGAGRFAANFLVIVLAGAPWTAFVIYLPMLGSQVAFGAISALVAVVVLDIADRRAERDRLKGGGAVDDTVGPAADLGPASRAVGRGGGRGAGGGRGTGDGGGGAPVLQQAKGEQ